LLVPTKKLATSGDGSFYHDDAGTASLKMKRLYEMFVNDLVDRLLSLRQRFSAKLVPEAALPVNSR